MKFLLILILAVSATECSTHPRHKTAHKKVVSSKTEKKPGIIAGDETGILVSADWLKRYKNLESKYGTIAEDGSIYAEGEHYRIPSQVATHFSDMIRLEKN